MNLRSFFPGLATMLALFILPATMAMADTFLIQDLDGHGVSYCSIDSAVKVDIKGFDYSNGDRTLMCLSPVGINMPMHKYMAEKRAERNARAEERYLRCIADGRPDCGVPPPSLNAGHGHP